MTAGTEERRRAAVAAQRRGPGAAGEVPAAAGPGQLAGDPPARGKVVARLLAPPFAAETRQDRCNRKLALLKVLDWLELHPGRTWQERWEPRTGGDRDWRDVLRELSAAGKLGPRGERVFIRSSARE